MNEQDDDKWFLELLEKIEAEEAAKRIRLENPYVLDLIRVLLPYRRGASRPAVLDAVIRRRTDKSLPIPPTVDAAIQSALQQYCADSDVFKSSGRPESDALFHWPAGKGKGLWAVHRGRAEAWLKARNAEIKPSN